MQSSETINPYASFPPEAQRLLNKFEAEKRTYQQELQLLRWQLDELKRVLHGRKSERHVEVSSNQQELFDAAALASAPAVKPEQVKVGGYERAKSKPAAEKGFSGRFPEWLPREVVNLAVTDELKTCPGCGGERKQFDTHISERLSYKHHVDLVVKEYHLPVCKCPRCESSIEAAPAPAAPLPGIQVESSFLAHIISQKYEYGMPFYRVEDLLSSKGLPMSRTTLCEYSEGVGRLLLPLLSELERCIKSGKYMHADETSWEVARVINGKKVYRTGWAWMLLGQGGEALIRYTESRKKKSFRELIGDYQGVVVCDGEDHYDHYAQTSQGAVQLSRCNAHARRYYEKALKSHKQEAALVLRAYRILYRREEHIGTKPPDERQRWRRRSRILMEYLQRLSQQWLLDKSILPKSPLGKACRYFVKFYADLVRFCSNGVLPIDNNADERLVRKFVIGRKAWLFSSSDEGARHSALLYSLVLTCRINDIPVIDYLTDVIERIGVGGETNFAALLPQAWQADRASSLK